MGSRRAKPAAHTAVSRSTNNSKSKPPARSATTASAAAAKSASVVKPNPAESSASALNLDSKQYKLRREIKALGGSKYDLDLVDGVESDADDFGPSDAVKIDLPSLSNELREFMKNDLKLPTPPESSSTPAVSKSAAAKPTSASAKSARDKQSPQPKMPQKSLPNPQKQPQQPQPQEAQASAKHPHTQASPKSAKQHLPASAPAPAPAPASAPVRSNKMLIQPTPLWHEIPLAPVAAPGVYAPADEARVAEMYQRAKILFDEEVAKFEKAKFQSRSDRDFIATVLRSGTTTDKISALTLLIQESPLHTLAYLRDHIVRGMAAKKSRRDALVAVDAVKDLFVGSVVPRGRKLRYFRDQGVLSAGVSPVHLVVWFFEDALKKLYFDFLTLLEELTKDPLPHIKSAALTHTCTLLTSLPEQEASLLALLVNKLGDTAAAPAPVAADGKRAGPAAGAMSAKAAHLLHAQVLAAHPDMAGVVVAEVERLLARADAGARYAAVTFLTQIALRRGGRDVDVARRLVGVYFAVFEQIVEGLGRADAGGRGAGKKRAAGKAAGGRRMRGFKSGNVRQSGVRRGVTAEEAEREGGVEAVGDSDDEAAAEAARIAAVSRGAPAPMPAVADSVDAKTMAALLTGVNRAFPYAQMDEEVFEKHMDKLFRISHLGTFNISIQALTLIFQVQTARETISDRFYSALYDTLIDARLAASSKHPMYLNLLHRALKADTSLTRVRAFIKRIVQACGMNQTPFICGALFLVGDVMRLRPGLWSLVTLPEEPEDDEANPGSGNGTGAGADAEARRATRYDAKKRNPLYCGAELSCLWDLTPYASHFHPTVALYASTLLSGNPIAVPASATAYDPLQNHTLTRFLDRFVFKNPKRVASAYRGTSLMQPRPPGMLAGTGARGAGSENLIAGARKRGVVVRDDDGSGGGGGSGGTAGAGVMMDDEPVNSAAFLRRRREDVPVDELFFYDYFMDKQARQKPSKAAKPAASGSGDEEEDEVWAAMQNSVAAGDADSDDDVGFDADELDDGDDDDFADADMASDADGDEAASDDEDDAFDMEAAMRDADAKHAKRKAAAAAADSDDEGDNSDGGLDAAGDDDGDDDGFEDVESDGDVDTVFDEGAGGSGSDSDGSDAGRGRRNAAGQKVSRPHAGKRAQALAAAAKRLGYTGEFFAAKLGKAKRSAAADDDVEEDGAADAFGDGFASYEDFVGLIEKDDGDEDTGAVFGADEPQFGVGSKKKARNAPVKRKSDATRGSAKRFKNR